MADLQTTLEWTASRLHSVLEATREVEHMGLRGSVTEREVRQILGTYLPGQYDVATGQIENSRGESSRQQDAVVLDRAVSIPFLISRDEGVFPLETVRATIEVKSNARPKTIADAVENVASVKRLCPKPETWTPFGGIICLSGNTKAETIARSYYMSCQEHQPCHRPDALLVLDRCVLVWGEEDPNGMLEITQPVKSGTQILVTSMGKGLLIFLVALIQHLDDQRSVPPPPFELLKYVNKPDSKIEYQLVTGNNGQLR